MQRDRVSSQQSPIQKLGDAHLTLSPNLSLAASTSCWPDPSSDLELSIHGQPLIPGLPDDVAFNCLLRLPVKSHTACKFVCKRWHLLLATKERFFTKRKELGFHNPWLYVHTFCKRTKKLQWHVLDLTNFSWHTIHSMPNKVFPQGFRCVSIPNEGILIVCGGMISDVECPLDLVLKYEMYKDQWSVVNKMIIARCFFAGELIDGLVYVAGGNSDDLLELNSAEVFDPKKGIWRRISSMSMNMASYDSAVLDGKFLVTEGWLWPFFVSPRGQVYDPENNSWENMAVGLREGWTGSSIVVFGRLFVVSEHERMKLKVYDKGSDSWETVDGPPLPEEMCKPFSVNSCDSRIFVVGSHLHVAVGHISRMGSDQKKWRFCVTWQVRRAPESWSELTPSSSQALFG